MTTGLLIVAILGLLVWCVGLAWFANDESKETRNKLSELREEIATLRANQEYSRFSDWSSCVRDPVPSYYPFGASAQNALVCAIPSTLTASQIIERLDELYAFLKVERKTNPEKTELVKKCSPLSLDLFLSRF